VTRVGVGVTERGGGTVVVTNFNKMCHEGKQRIASSHTRVLRHSFFFTLCRKLLRGAQHVRGYVYSSSWRAPPERVGGGRTGRRRTTSTITAFREEMHLVAFIDPLQMWLFEEEFGRLYVDVSRTQAY
jgi:hypothetical protein